MRRLLWIIVLLSITPLGVAEPPPLTAERYAQIVERLEGSLGALATPAHLSEWTRTARYATWSGANSSTMTEIVTAEAAAARAAEIRAQGFNAVMVSGRHYRQSYRDPAAMAEILRCLRLAVEACRAHGLRVIDHNDLTVFWSEAYPLVFRNPEWVQVDVRHGTPLRWFCLTNPDFTADVIAYLRRVLHETGVDGFMTDEVTFRPESCGCTHCRAGFERDTGYRLPTDSSSPALFNVGDPLWRLWQHWRSVSVRRFHRQIVAALQQDRADVLWLGYSTAFTGSGAGDGGADVFQRAQFVNYPGYEAINTTYPAALHLHSELRVRLGVYRSHHRFGWAQFPTSGSEEELLFAAMLSGVTGHAAWTSSRTSGLGRVFNWPHWDRLSGVRQGAADVAMIFSTATRDGAEALAVLHEAELLGMGQALLRRGVAYDVLIDSATGAAELSGYRAVVAPAIDAISPALAEALVAFAASGGGVLVTGDVGRRDQHGFAAPANALRSALQLVDAAPITPPPPRKPRSAVEPAPAVVRLTETGQRVLKLESPLEFADVQAYAARFRTLGAEQVLAKFENPGRPAAAIQPIGRGRLVHAAFLPGRAVYEPKLAVGAKITRRSDPAIDALIESLVVAAAGGPVTSVKGEGVMSSVYAEPGRRVVHLLNVSGIRLPEHGGELLRSASTPSYQPVGPIRITLRPGNIRSATLLSLDADEALELKWQRDAAMLRIDLPAGALQRYAAVEILE